MTPARMPPATMPPAHSGSRLVATDGRELPLESTTIEAHARAGFASVVLRQRFRNRYLEPLAVRYQVPLPADGAVSAFAFVIGTRRVAGEIDRKARARERFEEALLEGHAAALLDQERESLFSQEIGNIPPGEVVEAEIVVDQPLAWLAEGAWEWRFPTTVAPRYDAGVADADAIAVEVSATPISPRARLELRVEGDARPSSTSHAIALERRRGEVVVGFGEEGAALDRDVVVSWPAARPEVGAELVVARPPADHAVASRAFGLLTLVPPSETAPSIARDLVLLIDASGSMHGAPLDQARRLGFALVDSLSDGDTLSMISFAVAPSAWQREPVAATAEQKASARRWLDALEASGGTEMRAGILAALAPLRADAQRQVVLMSDGLIGFESEIVATILDRLPRGSRVHTVGVGSAVNRALTAAAARAGRGVEVILGLEDDVERALGRLVHHTAAPTVVDLRVAGSALLEHAPARLPDLFAAAPARVSLALRPEGGDLVITGRTAEGLFERRLEVGPVAWGQGELALARRFAREQVRDLEAEGARGRAVDGEIERLGLDFAIATRLTSWVAVSSEPTVDPTAPTRSETMPHALPHGMSAAALGLRSPAPFAALAMPAPAASWGPPPGGAPPAILGRARMAPPPPAAAAPKRKISVADESAKGRGAGSSAIALGGRVRLLRSDRLVIEITLDHDLDWNPHDLRLLLVDGVALEPTLDAAQSTRPGRHATGTVLRLAFALSAPLSAAPLRVELQSGNDSYAVTL